MTSDSISLEFSPEAHINDCPECVHIWFWECSRLKKSHQQDLTSLLSTSEKARAGRFKLSYLQERHIATRIFLRLCLSRYAGLPPAQLEFESTPKGKLYLRNSPRQLYFNLSHSDGLVTLAISLNSEVGIDIEKKRSLDFLALAQRFFHPNEFRQLEQAKDNMAETRFFRLWTLKEAVFKALGYGVGDGIEKLNIDLDCTPLQFTAEKSLQAQENEWNLVEKQLDPQTFVAVAHQSGSSEPLWFDGQLLFQPMTTS